MEDLEYQLESYQRLGVVVLFNHENFDTDLGLKQRAGTANDAVRLKNAFESRGFLVLPHFTDKSHAEIKSILKTVSESKREEYGSVVVVVLSHGLDGGQIAAKDKFYSASDLREPFLDNPAFKDKPLIFLHQACRGKHKDTFASAKCPSTCINGDVLRSGQNDVLLAFATLEGHESFRHQKQGSFYIQKICDILEKRDDIEILDLLTAANCEVIKSCAEAKDEKGTFFDTIQTATYKSSLLKRFVLRTCSTNAAELDAISDKSQIPEECYVSQPECEYRGPAIIFHDEKHTSEASEFLESMKELNFSCQTVDHEPTDRELINLSSNWNLKECSCIFIGIFFAESRLNFLHSRLLKHLNNNSCPYMNSKPKIFLFASKEGATLNKEKQDDVKSNRQVSCYSDVLAIYGYTTSFIRHFATHLKTSKEKDVIASARVAQRCSAQDSQDTERPCNVIMSSTLRFRVQWSKEMLVHDDSTLKVSPVFQYNVRDPVENFHFRTKELNDMRKILQEVAGKNINVWITGFGGLGKSQTVLQYIKNARAQNVYQNILWIDGSSNNTIISDIQSIAESLEINLPIGVDLKNKLNRFYSKIAELGKTLLVIDNLENLTKEELIDVLPKGHKNELFRIVVTSVHNVEKFKLNSKVEQCISISPFTREESKEFITKNLNTVDYIHEELIDTLGKELSYFPLGLGIAVGLANENMKWNSSPSNVIENILKNMQGIKEEDSKTKGYNKSLYQIVTHAMDHLVKNKENLALQYVKMMSFCEPENIPYQILFQSEKIGVETTAVRKLKSLQIINTNKDLYSIHRIVQTIVCNSLGNREEQKYILKHLLENVVKLQKVNNNYSQAKKYILHASKVCDNISSFSDLYIENKECIITISKDLHFVGWYENAKKFNEIHLKIISQIFGCESKEFSELLLNKITILRLKDEFKEALNSVAVLENHIDSYSKQKLHEKKSHLSDTIHFCDKQRSRNLNNLNENMDDIKAGIEELDKFYESNEEQRLPNTLYQDELELKTKHAKAKIFIAMGDFLEANNILQDVLQKMVNCQDIKPYLVCNIKHSMTHVLIRLFKFEEALALLEEIVPQMIKIGKETDDDMASVMISKAYILHSLGRNAEALNIIEKAEKLTEKIFDETHPSALQNKFYKGAILRGLERYKEALEVYDFVLEHRQKYFDEDHFEIQSTLHYRAKVLEDMGHFDEALTAFQSLLEAKEKKYGSKSQQVACTMDAIASCYYSKGEYHKALQLYRKALQLLEGLLPATYPETQIVKGNIDNALQAIQVFQVES